MAPFGDRSQLVTRRAYARSPLQTRYESTRTVCNLRGRPSEEDERIGGEGARNAIRLSRDRRCFGRHHELVHRRAGPRQRIEPGEPAQASVATVAGAGRRARPAAQPGGRSFRAAAHRRRRRRRSGAQWSGVRDPRHRDGSRHRHRRAGPAHDSVMGDLSARAAGVFGVAGPPRAACAWPNEFERDGVRLSRDRGGREGPEGEGHRARRTRAAS